MPRRALAPFPTPTLDIDLPACAKADCTEYIAAGVACATATAVNACYCNRLTWPMACTSACPGLADSSSVASWYWDLCPSAMDSALGVFGITHLATPAFTVDAWEVQTPTTGLGVFTSGYDCYYSGQCTFVSTMPTITPVPTSGQWWRPCLGGGRSIGTLLLVLCVALGFWWWKKRRSTRQRRTQNPNEDLVPVLLDIIIGSHHANTVAIQDLRASIHGLAQEVRSRNRVGTAPAPVPTPAPAPSSSNTAPGSTAATRLAMIKELLTCPITVMLKHIL